MKRTEGKQLKFASILNPFFMYALVWSIVLIVRSFNINHVYPATPMDLWIFIFLTIVIALFLGFVYNSLFLKKISSRTIEVTGKYPPYFLAVFCILGFIASVVYTRSVPIIDTIRGTAESYREFGIPTVTPLVICATLALNAIASVKFFYGNQKKLANFIIIAICWVIFLLIFSRGALIICVATSLLIAFSRTRFSFKKGVAVILLALIFAFVFNIFGNIRQQSAWNDSSFIMTLSGFDPKYNWLSNFSWAIVYVDSPLGNLSYNVEYVNYLAEEHGLISQLIPDLIAKRLWDVSSELYLPCPALNVASMYAGSYKFFGMFGMAIQFLEVSIISFLVAAIGTRRAETFLTLSAYLSVLMAMTFFDNVFMYSGFSFAMLVIIVFDLIRYPNPRRVVEAKTTLIKEKA